MQTICPHCQTELNVGDQLAGRKMKCTACNQLFLVPTPSIGAFSATPVKSSESAFSAAPLPASAGDALQDDLTPDLRALRMFRTGKDEHEIVDALLRQGCGLEQAKEAMNQGRKMHCAEINGATTSSSAMAIFLCILGGLMFLIGTFASIVSYSDANVGGSGTYTVYGGIVIAGLFMFFRGLSNVLR
jgi:predicted Zn finger-like uncharacterized protein